MSAKNESACPASVVYFNLLELLVSCRLLWLRLTLQENRTLGHCYDFKQPSELARWFRDLHYDLKQWRERVPAAQKAVSE